MPPFDQPASDFMTSPVEAIHPDALLPDVLRRLDERGISCLAAVDDDARLSGVISRTDVLRVGRLRAAMADDGRLLTMPNLRVRERMVTDVATVDPGTPLRVAAERMLRRHVHRVFVVDHQLPVGVVSTRDLMAAVVAGRVTSPIARWMSAPVQSVDVRDPIARATDRLADAHVRGVVVLDEEWPVGVFTQSEALAAADVDPSTPVEDMMSLALLCLPIGLPVFRAAAFALETRARRILAVEAREIRGILSGLDMARVVADAEDGAA